MKLRGMQGNVENEDTTFLTQFRDIGLSFAIISSSIAKNEKSRLSDIVVDKLKNIRNGIDIVHYPLK